MNSLLHNNILAPYSSSTLKKHRIDSLLNNSHPRFYQLTQLIKLSKNGNHQNHILRHVSTTMTFGAPFTTKNKCHNLKTQNTKFDGLKITSDTLATNLSFREPLLAGGSCRMANPAASENDQYSQADLRQDNMPKHVAIILDGSRRWLKAHGKPLTYDPFFQSNLLFADLCIKWGVGTATTFLYSLKNLERGKEANDLIFGQLELFLDHNIQQFRRKGIKINMIGEIQELPKTLQNKIRQVEEATKECTKLELMLALCYAGTRDIVKATRSICDKVTNGEIEAETIDERLFESELSTNRSRAPQIDLVIRTGGRIRVSDYLMWQLAQAELYFTNVCAPDFGELEFIEALRSFQLRERTFGK